ncbi:MAG: Rab family GTPase [Coleofasciculaceae cyanobacterium]
MSILSKKICLVGDFGVGKTSLIRRFVERQFSDQYLSTVGVKISRKTIDLPGETPQETVKLQLMIWDLEGHTKFKSIAPSYLQGASGVIIVADVTRLETVQRVPEHIDLFLSVNPKGSVVIAAFNKSDLLAQEEIAGMKDIERIEQVLATYQTSAKTGLNVDEIFYKLAYSIVKSP